MTTITAHLAIDIESDFEFDADVDVEVAEHQAKDELLGYVFELLNTDPDKYLNAELAEEAR